MKTINNGSLGTMSVIGLGCWNLGNQWAKTTTEESIQIIRRAIDGGISFVDVAESYGIPDGQCEIILGQALKDGYREKVIIVSKVGWYGQRGKNAINPKSKFQQKLRAYHRKITNKMFDFKEIDFIQRTPELIRLCGQACCGRLKTDYIDVLLCHDGNIKNPQPFIDGFRALKAEGFIKHYGISTNDLNVLKRFYEYSEGECEVCECEYSLLNKSPEKTIFPFCQEHNIAILTRSALSMGLLAGKYNLETHFSEEARKQWNKGGALRDVFEKKISVVEKIKTIVKIENLASVAYRYAFSGQCNTSVVIGATSLGQIEENLNIASEFLDTDIYKLLSNM